MSLSLKRGRSSAVVNRAAVKPERWVVNYVEMIGKPVEASDSRKCEDLATGVPSKTDTLTSYTECGAVEESVDGEGKFGQGKGP